MPSMKEYLAIVFCLKSVLCFDCQVLNRTKGFRISVHFDSNGLSAYRLWDKNGSEWPVVLKEINGQIGVEFGEQSSPYDPQMTNRFGLNCESHSINCEFRGQNRSYQTIGCVCGADVPKSFELYYFFDDPIFLKPRPDTEGRTHCYFVGLNRNDKSESFEIPGLDTYCQTNRPSIPLSLKRGSKTPLKFLNQMPEQLFKQIDSIVEYNLRDRSYVDRMSGHLLWFDIDGRNYYCTQPKDKDLSSDVRQ